MSIDLYTITKDQDGFDPEKLELKGDLACYINQIRNCIITDENEILGASDMTFNIEKWVYSYNLNEQQIKSKIEQVLRDYCSFSGKFRTLVSVKFGIGTVRDICIVDLDIDGIEKPLRIITK